VTDEVRELVSELPHMFHIAEPEDVARVIAHLVSDDGKLLTGNVIHLR
jgi:3-oxoacyl-[acyl-carrier protein] reductase